MSKGPQALSWRGPFVSPEQEGHSISSPGMCSASLPWGPNSRNVAVDSSSPLPLASGLEQAHCETLLPVSVAFASLFYVIKDVTLLQCLFLTCAISSRSLSELNDSGVVSSGVIHGSYNLKWFLIVKSYWKKTCHSHIQIVKYYH